MGGNSFGASGWPVLLFAGIVLVLFLAVVVMQPQATGLAAGETTGESPEGIGLFSPQILADEEGNIFLLESDGMIIEPNEGKNSFTAKFFGKLVQSGPKLLVVDAQGRGLGEADLSTGRLSIN